MQQGVITYNIDMMCFLCNSAFEWFYSNDNAVTMFCHRRRTSVGCEELFFLLSYRATLDRPQDSHLLACGLHGI